MTSFTETVYDSRQAVCQHVKQSQSVCPSGREATTAQGSKSSVFVEGVKKNKLWQTIAWQTRVVQRKTCENETTAPAKTSQLLWHLLSLLLFLKECCRLESERENATHEPNLGLF